METKKVLGIIFSSLFVIAFAFVLTWGIINFNTVKDGMSGTGVYTKQDVDNAYNDGYNTALTDKAEYTSLISSYRDTITTLNDEISQLNSQVNNLQKNNKDYSNQVESLTTQKNTLQAQVTNLTNIKETNETTIADLNEQITSLQKQVKTLTSSDSDKDEQIKQLNSQISNLQNTVSQLQTTNELNSNTIDSLNSQITSLNNQIIEITANSQDANNQINALNNKINELQKSINYYESYIASLENGEQVVATFEYDGSVYNIQIVNKNSKLAIVTPTSTEYKIFNGWKVNNEFIDLESYTITTNTKIVADITYKYDVTFVVDSSTVDSQTVTQNGYATLPTTPTKDGYEFDGWTLNGTDIIEPTTIAITHNTTFTAKFTKLHTVTFIYEDTTYTTQTIRNNEFCSSVSVENTNYKVFNGWTLNGVIADITTQKIVADTTFIADITYKYDVTFVVDSSIVDSQIVTQNGYATLPTTPTKDGYEFDGWTLNGTDIVEPTTIAITHNTTFTAKFSQIHTVTFVETEWNGLTDFLGSCIWTDGDNIYYSSTTKQYVLDKETSTWTEKTWNGLTNFYGSGIWTDGDNIYYSYDLNQYVLNKDTSTWVSKGWSGLSRFSASNIWTDGDNIYYSKGSTQYQLNKTANTWRSRTWKGLSSFDGSCVWTDGENVFASYGSSYQFVLIDGVWKTSSAYSSSSAYLGAVDGHLSWTDGKLMYFTYVIGSSRYDYSSSRQVYFDKETFTFKKVNLVGLDYINPLCIWTDGENIYYSNGTTQYKLVTD